MDAVVNIDRSSEDEVVEPKMLDPCLTVVVTKEELSRSCEVDVGVAWLCVDERVAKPDLEAERDGKDNSPDLEDDELRNGFCEELD